MVKRFRETARIALSLVLCLGMLGTTVFASEIPDGETTAQEEVQQTEEDAESLEAEESSGTDTSSEDAISGSDNSIDTTENVLDTVEEDAAELSAPEEVVEDVDADSSEITGECTDDDGVTISVDAPEGAFPAGTELVITPEGDMAFDVSFRQYIDDQDASLDEEAEILEDAESGRKYIELQPADGYTVSVKFTLPAIEELEDGETAEVQVVHIADDGAKEDVGEAVTVEADETIEVAVEAESFSTYVVQITVSNSAASLNGEKYESIQKAVDAAGDSTSTIKLLATVTESVTVTSGNITFDLNGYTWTGNGDTVLTSNGANITITGTGTMKAVTGYRVLEILNAYLTVGVVGEEGPSITGSGSSAQGYTINKEDLQNKGGAVYVSSGTFTLNSGTITKGKAYCEASKTYAYGDGVCVENGTFNMNGGTITLNYAQTGFLTYGVGVAVLNGTFNMTGGEISSNKNTASYSGAHLGGGVYVGSSSTATISGGKITNNTYMVNMHGAGVAVDATSSLTVTGSAEISNNTAYCRNTYGGSGGGIYVARNVGKKLNGTLIISGGTISGNTAVVGGGVYCPGITMTDGAISGNTSTTYGGGLQVDTGVGANVFFTGGVISGNTATTYGGGISIQNSNSTGNTSMIDLKGVEISGNTAKTYGGGVVVYGNNATTRTLEIDKTTLTYGNTAEENDGATVETGSTAHASDEFLLMSNLNLVGFTVTGEDTGITEHVISANKAEYTLRKYSNTIKLSSVNKDCAAYYNNQEVKLEKSDCINANGDVIVLEPKEGQTGAHVHYWWDETTQKAVAMTGGQICSTLEEAYAKAKETEIYTIVVCSTVSVTADTDDALSDSKITLERCSYGNVDNTIATGNTGAVISVNGAEVTINGATIDGKNFNASSALVTVSNNGMLTLTSGTIKNGKNTSSNGGGIYVRNSKLNINGGTVCDNEAKSGGGIYLNNYATGNFEGGTIQNNVANGAGGGVFVYDHSTADFGVNGGCTVVTGNSCTGEGGGITYKDNSTGKIYHAKLTDNECKLGLDISGSGYAGGGAMHIYAGCKVEMKNVYMDNNKYTTNFATYGTLYTCSTGNTGVLEEDGALITNSKTGGSAIKVTAGGSFVSNNVLGGDKVTYTDENGNVIDSAMYQWSKDGFVLYVDPDQSTIDDAASIAESKGVVITGNKSSAAGSAIANNGTLIIGTAKTTLKVTKVWDGDDNHPDNVVVQLQKQVEGGEWKTPVGRDDVVKTLSDSNDWTAVWTDLDDNVQWRVVEVNTKDYVAEYTYSEETSLVNATFEGLTYQTETIKNTYSAGVNPGTLTISKTAVNLTEGATYSFTIKLENLSDDTKLLSYTDASGVLQPISVTSEKTATVTIELASGQSITINGLPVGTAYTVTEAADTTSYTTTVNGASAVSSTGTISEEASAVTLKFENTKVTVVEEEPVPNSPTPTTTITEEDTPLAELPEEDVPEAELPVDIVEVDDEDVPLADVPNTTDEIGQYMSVWIFVSIVALIAAGTTLFIRRKRRDEI